MPVFSAKHLRAEVYPAAAAAPLLCLCAPQNMSEALRAALAAAPAHTLVCVYGFDWGARSFAVAGPGRSGADGPFPAARAIACPC